IIDKNEFYFRNIDKIGLNQVNRFVVSGASGATQIWDITDAQNITQLPVIRTSGTVTFVANTNTLHQYLAINPDYAFPKPNFIVNNTVNTVANQNLHALPQTDLVIISPAEFLGEAERLAEAHRRIDNIRVQVVDVQKIYNEFSSGTPDATAYRLLMKMFYDRGLANNDLPKNLLLFGDGCYDNRGLLNNTSNNIRRLLTFQAVNSTSTVSAYVCDDYFGYMKDSTGTMLPSQIMSIGVGRLPVYKLEQAKTVVDKTVFYMENSFRTSWKNRVLFVADDADDNQTEHEFQVDSVSRITSMQNPDILVRKLYLDAYKQETSAAGQRYPMVNTLLDNYIQSGVLMINYMGHGSYNAWANEQIMTTAKILNMVNDKYPLIVTATCDFTAYDQFYDTGGEQLLWNKTGGTMALVTTVRTVYSAPNFKLNCYFAKNIFETDENDEPITLGEAVKRAKNLQNDNVNKFSFALVGDPALRLVYPYEGKVATDSINHRAVNSFMLDTVSALGEVTIKGHIETRLGDLIQSFNGVVHVQVFDKIDTVATLANDGGEPFKFLDRPNAIFSGSARVTNGKFTFSFIVPKDIRYNFGTGRIVYYATEDNYGMEANGHLHDFVIGGESTGYIANYEGPKVRLYMNTPDFINGGKVNTSPLFVAEVFDENGINTVGGGIGHDIIMRINGDKQQETILNDYYTSVLGSYKEGKVEYLLRDLPFGKYKLYFRVWDLQNNSTSDEITFEVSKDIRIDAETNYYFNPETNEITFIIDHDRPYKPLDITANVYDIAGRHLWTSTQNTLTSGTHTEVKWNFKNEGLFFSQGMYIVRIEITAKDEKSFYKPVKIIITTQ
ncbi:MAG: type IX secretion system sortase PorU, partial [Prevotellaceae bacterium]|nr:type IX secretion system sortase PorU [Prevotellaceae bacterium]